MCVCYGGMKKNKHIFISRALSPGSVFREELTAVGCTVEGLSLVAFKRRNFQGFPETDWIFFYSAKAAAFFWEGLQQSGQSWPEKAQIATIGKSTAEWLQARGIAVSFIGTGTPEETCQLFLETASGQRVLFPQASHSRRSVEKLAGRALRAEQLIVYDNDIKKDFDLTPPDILTFTSPLNAQAYFMRYPGKAAQPIVAIGKTTRQAVKRLGQEVAVMAEEPGEAALVRAVLSCLS